MSNFGRLSDEKLAEKVQQLLDLSFHGRDAATRRKAGIDWKTASDLLPKRIEAGSKARAAKHPGHC